MKTIQVKINKDIGAYKVGEVVFLATDKHGLPLDRFMRARLKDAEIDNCIERVTEQKQTKRKLDNDHTS